MFLWKHLTKKRLTTINSFIVMFQNLTQQGEDIRINCNKNNKIHSRIFIMLVTLWIILCLVLSYAFTGLLLNTFFRLKPSPVVNTLQDIRDNKQLLIMGDAYSLSYIYQNNNFDISDIIERIEQSDHFYNTNRRSKLFDVVNGITVLVYNTFRTSQINYGARFYQDRLFISPSKYFPDYMTFFILKNEPYTKMIEF